MVGVGVKLITKDSRSTNSNEFIIVEQPQYKAKGIKVPGKPLEIELTGKTYFVVYHLEEPGIFDDRATFQDFFYELKEAKEKYPNVEVLKWEDVQKK